MAGGVSGILGERIRSLLNMKGSVNVGLQPTTIPVIDVARVLSYPYVFRRRSHTGMTVNPDWSFQALGGTDYFVRFSNHFKDEDYVLTNFALRLDIVATSFGVKHMYIYDRDSGSAVLLNALNEDIGDHNSTFTYNWQDLDFFDPFHGIVIPRNCDLGVDLSIDTFMGDWSATIEALGAYSPY